MSASAAFAFDSSPAATRRRRTLLAGAGVALVLWALAASFIAVDVTEFTLVTRFGKLVQVHARPGLRTKAPFDRVVRLNKRLLATQPPKAEYLTVDKKNIVVEALATWRIIEAERYFARLGTRAHADAQISDSVNAWIGTVLGQYPAAALIAASGASQYRKIVDQIRAQVAAFAAPAYGIEIIDIDILALSLPEQNREHVFNRMQAERGKMAKELRSFGELEAKKIIAAADRERTRIESEANAQALRFRAEGDAEAARIYAAAYGSNANFYKFLRTLQAYGKFLDDSTTLFLPADAEVFALLRPGGRIGSLTPRSPAPRERTAPAQRLPPMTEKPRRAAAATPVQEALEPAP